jgi:hypothetical protein
MHEFLHFKRFKFWLVDIQNHSMPRYLYGRPTAAPSYIRIFFNHKFVLDINMPKWGSK